MGYWSNLRNPAAGILSCFSSRQRYFSSSPAASIYIKRVKKSNYDLSFEELQHHVRAADFVSIDLEMTGVTSAPWRESLEFDRSDVRYLKVKDSAEKFAVIQFGVCPFRWDALKQSFVAHPHNFYIFPRKEIEVDGPSFEFLCQTDSIDFLAKFQFDFNACIHEGISYLSRAQEAEAFHKLCSRHEDAFVNSQHKLNNVQEAPLLSTFDILFSERMKSAIFEWRDWLLQNSCKECEYKNICNDPMPQLLAIFFKMRPALKFTGFTSHQMRLIKLVVEGHFQDLVYICIGEGNSSHQRIIVYTDSDEDRALLMKEVKEDLNKKAEEKIRAAVGFRHVIDLLSCEKKLIVGHNCFLDIAHIYSKFIGPLPPSIEEFSSNIHKSFPYLVDTKHIMKASNFQHLMRKTSSLSSAFDVLCPQIAYPFKSLGACSHSYVNVEIPVEGSRSSEWIAGSKHEAGYDAFMTGCIFAQMCCNLGIDFKHHSTSLQLLLTERLQKFMNLLYLSWHSGILIDLNSGTEILESGSHKHRRYPKVEFENIVLVWGFPSNLKPQELRECICKAFGPDSTTSVYYLDKTAAFIQFSESKFVTDFLLMKENLGKKNDPISVLHPLAKLLAGGKTRAATYDVYKQICSSSISKLMFADQAEVVGIASRKKEMGVRENLDCEKLTVGL